MSERLAITVSLSLAGATHAVPGGAVRLLELSMTPYGLVGALTFVVQDDSGHGGDTTDAVLADFLKPDLGSVSLSVQAVHTDSSTTAPLPTITAQGLIVEKELEEHTYERQLDKASVLVREYTIRFRDAASALWTQHFPRDLFVEKTMKDVLEAHRGDRITLTYDWDLLTTVRPQVFVHLPPRAGASFFDFVAWFVDRYEGVFTYDQTAGTYAFAAAKDASGDVGTFARTDIRRMRSRLPVAPRASIRVVNSDTASASTRVIENTAAATGIFRDVLLRTAVAQQVDDRVTLETSRPRAPERVMEVAFAHVPIVPVVPGSLVDVSSKGGFSEELLASDGPWRVFALELRADASGAGPDQTVADDARGFDLTLDVQMESADDPTPRRPAFVRPEYPGFLEGTVVSDVGEASDVTYEFHADATTSQNLYKIKIPLFTNQVVVAPFEPQEGSGMFYIPTYKGARVLVALDFATSRIDRLLDWRAGAQVPLDGQGQQLLLGKSAESNTRMVHDYQSDKPVFRILRTNAKDSGLIHIEEGLMRFVIQEGSSE